MTEILADLDAQMADSSSPLRNGNVTAAAKGVSYATSLLAEDSSSIDSTSATVGLSVMQYQPKGLFGFESVILYTTEASGTATLTISRDHGTKDVMDIGYATSDGSAKGGDDYIASTGIVRFYDGDTVKTFEVELLDNHLAEQHFKAFQVTLTLRGPINDGASLREATSVATVYVYDYGDTAALANTTFSLMTLSPDAQEPPFENTTIDYDSAVDSDGAAGWTVADNGGEKGWVESLGFAARDNVVGADEYGEILKHTGRGLSSSR